MLQFLRSAAVMVTVFTVSGCATLNVNSQMRRATDFAGYRTFAWGPADALPTGDPRLDQNPSFKDYMAGAVERQFSTRGLQLASDAPDLLIHYHANVSERINVNAADQQFGYCYDEDCAARVVNYDAGTLVLDMVDARTNRVVWRGWAQGSLEGVIDHPDRLRRMVRRSVVSMLEHFPPAN
jgi:hypothetical protein